MRKNSPCAEHDIRFVLLRKTHQEKGFNAEAAEETQRSQRKREKEGARRGDCADLGHNMLCPDAEWNCARFSKPTYELTFSSPWE